MPTRTRFLVAVAAVMAAALGTAGCVVYQAPREARVYAPPPPPPAEPPPAPVYEEPAPQAVVSVYVEPPMSQPPPIAVGWAPPPLLVEAPPPMPFVGATWVGGYWVWEGNWVWAAGRWAPPPQPGYVWVHPYYEHRDGAVIFITGHWHAPGVVFVPPPPTLRLTVVMGAPGVRPGPRPFGPPGVFVPAPPGSRMGIIVPAPIGTPPAVVTSAPPVVSVGMRIQAKQGPTHVTNVTNVTIVAPAGATAGGKAFESAVPAQAHLAAGMTPVVHARAPVPASAKPIPAYVPGRAPAVLPPAQPVQAVRSAPVQSSANAPMPAVPPSPAVVPPGLSRETPAAIGKSAAPAPVPQQFAAPAPNAREPGHGYATTGAQQPAQVQQEMPRAAPVATSPATPRGQPGPQRGYPPSREDIRGRADAPQGAAADAKTARAEQGRTSAGNAAQAKAASDKDEKRKRADKERE